MIHFAKRLLKDRRGNALAIAAAALPLVIGSAGLAADTIQWTLWKRQLQRAADSGALAGVYAKIQGQAIEGDNGAVAIDLGKNNHTGISLLAGYPVIAYPANTSGYQDAVKVTLALRKELGFSSLFMPNPPTITAEATAATIETGVYCVVSLVATGATGITATGNGSIDLGCGMITNSTSLTAAIATGSSQVNASPIAAVGNINDSDNWGDAELLPFTVAQEDPFAEVEPPPFSPCKGNANKLPNTNQNSPPLNLTHQTGVVCYSDMNIGGTVNLGSATYVIDGGDFTVGSQAHVTCNGCTIVLTNSDTSSTAAIGDVDITAGAEIDMSAPTSGDFDGILMYQDRRASSASNTVNKINGNSDSLMSGAFYFPKQQLQINGTAGLDFNCAQFVAYIVEFAGNGSINNTCTAGYGEDEIKGRHVRLVA
jgi:Flp pilus assembly protein TadG